MEPQRSRSMRSEHGPYDIGLRARRILEPGKAADPGPLCRGFARRTKNGTLATMPLEPILDVVFFRADAGTEPVRDWLKSLSRNDRSAIGADLKTVQFGWPVGMPVVRKLEPGLWEVRSRLDLRIARIIFTVSDRRMVLLHGFIKKSQKTPASDLDLAKRRRAELGP